MSDIANIAGNIGSPTSRLQRAAQIEPTHRPTTPTPDRFGRSDADAVELSDQAQKDVESQAQSTAPTDRSARIQAEIRRGPYDTEARLDQGTTPMIDNAPA